MKKALLLVLMFGVAVALTACGYTPTRYEDATNKQMSDFHKWEAKQNQKNWDNSKAFK